MTAELFSKRVANKGDFSPQSVPVVRVDTDLPAIPRSRQTPAALEQLFGRVQPSAVQALLGADAHLHEPADWQAAAQRQGAHVAKPLAKAAVLLPIVRSEHPSVLLTQRSLSLSSHAGQIALPGGRVDPHDLSVADTALREAHEEVGLEAKFVTVLGQLPHITTNTGFEIWPVVGLVNPAAKAFLKPNPGEVDDVFEVPLDFVLNPANHRHHHYRDDSLERQWLSMPYQDAQAGKERYIWGVTASVLRSFYRYMQQP